MGVPHILLWVYPLCHAIITPNRGGCQGSERLALSKAAARTCPSLSPWILELASESCFLPPAALELFRALR